MREKLDTFPARIQDVYIQTWRRILDQPKNHVLLAKRVLLWVLNATGSLTVDQVRRAVATSLESHKFHEDRMVPEAILMGLCRGLVTVDQESRLVRLVRKSSTHLLVNVLCAYRSSTRRHR
jgi:ankyrin repeat domain-containing protein 50